MVTLVEDGAHKAEHSVMEGGILAAVQDNIHNVTADHLTKKEYNLSPFLSGF